MQFLSGYFWLLVVAAVFVAPLLLSYYLVRVIRLPDYFWKLFLIFFVLSASAAVLRYKWPPRLGIDLSGGLMMVYEVDQSKKTDPNQKVDMEKLIEAVKKRIDPSGTKETTVRRYGVEAEQVEIMIPNVAEADVPQIKEQITRIGTLEFRILANSHDHRQLISRATAEPEADTIYDSRGDRLGWWVPVHQGSEHEFTHDERLKTRVHKKGKKEETQVLVANDDDNVTGDYLTSEGTSFGEKGPTVTFGFNSQGAERFSELTGRNLPEEGFARRLGIILDGELQTAPGIQSRISNQGEISGIPTEQERQATVAVLKAGSLPAALTKEPLQETLVGPTLGQDTIRQSKLAMLISAILVPAFMLVYYRFAGMVANICLVVNMVVLVAVMLAVNAAFTLTGLAGLALAVGMAVDNNVLLYERMREELHRGATIRMAIRNAFHRVGVVIVDANLTHIIAATVLFVLGSEQVKGFAITFLLGAVLSLWTSLFVARWVFEISEKKQWLTKLKMMHVIGDTHIDFMAWFPAALTFSILITVGGLAVAFCRGKGLFDIDFTGGVSIQAVFRKPIDAGKVREAVSHRLADPAVTNVRDPEHPNTFMINTSNSNKEDVQNELQKIFGNKLMTNSVTASAILPVAAAKPPQAEPAKPKAEEPAKPKAAQPAKPQAEGPAKTAKPKTEPPAKTAKPKAGEAAKPKTEPVQPPPKEEKAADKHARDDLPSDSLLALAGPLPLALADPKPSGSAEPSPSTSPPAKQEAAKAPPARAAETPAAAPQTPAITPETPAIAPEAPAIEDRFLGGAQTTLKFAYEVNHGTAAEMVARALRENEKALGVVAATVPLELTNPDFSEGDRRFKRWDLKIKLPPEKAKLVVASLQEEIKATPYFPSASTIGGAVATLTRYQASYALVASWTLIIIYLWIRFQGVAFGLAAVIALIHDVLVMLGGIAFSYYIADYTKWLGIDQFKINLPIVAAFLTIIGYSVNDTIVVFDRIREVRGKDPRMTRQMVNDSTNQTLSRTLLTSFTVMLVVVILYIFGGDAIHGFAFALMIGVLTGTYSSIYVAAPILLWLIHPKAMRKN
jgi:SecD/SecF fusion protein